MRFHHVFIGLSLLMLGLGLARPTIADEAIAPDYQESQPATISYQRINFTSL